MTEKIYTFWEGKMPEYLKLCIDTWNFPFVILNYENLKQYTDQIPDKVKQLSLPKIADYVRVHVLCDNGGYWLDTDTIVCGSLPEESILGNDKNRTNTIGFLHTEPQSDMYKKWVEFQDNMIKKLPNMTKDNTRWDIMGNLFTDEYLKNNKDIKIGSIDSRWLETYMIKDNSPRPSKYQKFYFDTNYTLKDVYIGSMKTFGKEPDIFMLHNSWTPDWYKKLSKEDVLKQKCTLSNILRETV
ncbi:MAG: hypothetical protein IJH65_08270 [Methanobrevibacter sp.]|nr:hypothetical protein [Methanobrevibacter sp.]